ncbi:MAG: hypothetical protein LQ344_001747 [Seirophora lacunosa]|nr:MAG: hypothetical protein LQ344_001747 [Seirophora lacunosa]
MAVRPPVPRPKRNNVYVLGITGLPPQCYTSVGWQIVKDLVRVVLEHHGLIKSGDKPGMVHTSLTPVEVSDVDKDDSGTEHEDEKPPGPASTKVTKKLVTAHVNMKTLEAALHACNTIAGNRLWRYPLNAAVFYGDTECAMAAGHGHEGFSEKEPHELADRFRITVPGGSHTWDERFKEKATKGGTDTSKRKQRRVQEAPSMQAMYMQEARMNRSDSDISSCSTLVDGRPQIDEGFHAGGGGGQYFPSLGWAVDWYGKWVPVYQSAWGQSYGMPPFCASQHVGVVKESRCPTLEDIMAPPPPAVLLVPLVPLVVLRLRSRPSASSSTRVCRTISTNSSAGRTATLPNEPRHPVTPAPLQSSIPACVAGAIMPLAPPVTQSLL